MQDLQELQSRVDRIDGFYQAIKFREADLQQEIVALQKDIDLLTKTGTVLKHLLDVMVKDEINKMSKE
jgi:hypothetical protein